MLARECRIDGRENQSWQGLEQFQRGEQRALVLPQRRWWLVTCLCGPTGGGQKLCEALAAVLGHCQDKAVVCF